MNALIYLYIFDLILEVPSIEVDAEEDQVSLIKWENFNIFQNEIHEILNTRFDAKILENFAFCRENNPCHDPSHKILIDGLTDYLIDSILESTGMLHLKLRSNSNQYLAGTQFVKRSMRSPEHTSFNGRRVEC